MTQIFKREPAQAPATHAFVLGCGRFPNIGSSASRQSTVAGARAIVRYLLDQQDALVAPLASIECLLSDSDVPPGRDQLGVGKFNGDPRHDDTVDCVTTEKVTASGLAWLELCRRGDHMFFYMSSHGIADHDATAAGLFEDVRSNRYRQWAASLNINILAANLPLVGAGACWVFLDACQELVSSILSRTNGASGVILVDSSPNDLATTKVRSLSLAGSRFGQQGWGPDGPEPPYFTQALLRSFEACVDMDPNGNWVVTGERLLCNVPKVADAAFGYSALEVESLARFANQASLVKVARALIPVVVRTDNLADMAYLISVTADDGHNQICSSPQHTNCFLEVAPTWSLYKATADFNGKRKYQPAQFHAHPCAQIVTLMP